MAQLITAQWVQVNNGMNNNYQIYTLASSGSNIVAGCYSPVNGVYRSTDYGAAWTQTQLNNRIIYALAVSGNNIYAGTDNNGVYSSTNSGVNWTQTPKNFLSIISLAANGSYVYAGTTSVGVEISSNNGSNWVWSSLNNRSVYALGVNGSNVFAGTVTYGVYLSTNSGTNWAQTSLNNKSIFALALSGNNIFAGSTNTEGVYLSTNNGTNWAQTSLNNRGILSLALNENSVFAGTAINGFYVSSNFGSNWTQKNEGIASNTSVFSICIFNNYVYIGTNTGVYKRQLGDLVQVLPVSSEVPNSYSLQQNYPNPFNPVTNIEFSVPVQSFVKIVVHNVLGKEISVIVNENLKAGTYKADWNAANYSSGVYFYKLETESFTETKKMILIK